MNYRIEHDTMGEIAVPAERKWGAQTQRSKENFRIGGQRQPMEIITAFAYLKEACARANADVGKLTAEQAEAVALSELLDRFLRTEEETDRRLFLGRYWHGAAVKDLAAGSGLSPNAVTKRLAKTRERLRAYLTERGYSL